MSFTNFGREGIITVVTGLPRSGTSMMMQMLAAGGVPPWTDEVRESDADNPKGYYECEKVKSLARENSWLAEAKGHAIKIVAPLVPNLPPGDYRFIFMERNINEILRSQAEMLKRAGKTGARLSNQQLAAIFQGQLKNAEDFVHNAAYPTLHVSYSNCVQEPSSTAIDLNKFLGGDLNQDSMAAEIDGALYRQRD